MRKLIEVALPLAAINAASAHEKSIKHGHPSTLHLWWARRPLAACRAVLFAQLVDDPGSHPEHFAGEAAQQQERERLFRIIEDLVQWKNVANETVLHRAQTEIARSLAWQRGETAPQKPAEVRSYLAQHGPPICDPFCGGGSIPLEAQRLGLRAYGSDLNPVAVLISKALVEIPPRFAGRKPVNPESAERSRSEGWRNEGAQGLAEDIRYYGRWMRGEAERRIGHLYPKVEVTDEAVRQQPGLAALRGEELTPMAYLWARTVPSPNPACRGAQVPLISSFVLSSKQQIIAIPKVNDASNNYHFELKAGVTKEEMEQAKKGTQAGKRAGFICRLSGSPISFSYIKSEAQAGRMKQKLMAVVAENKGRVYLPPTESTERIAEKASPSWKPDHELPLDYHPFVPPRYGMTNLADLFTNRQLAALATLSDLIAEVKENILKDTDSGDYEEAVTTYLAMGVSKQTNRLSNLCFWDNTGQKIQQVFGRQALSMIWDFCEANPLSSSSGNFIGQVDYLANVVKASPKNAPEVSVMQADSADSIPHAVPFVVATDPPYYDYMAYADLSDFFYNWLRYSLRSLWPNLFSTVQTPKAAELTALEHRRGGKQEADAHFLNGMKNAFRNMLASDSHYPITVFYAFKQAENRNSGTTATGWSSFLQALLDCGFTIDGTWPMRTELTGALKKRKNALASSIVLVCRPRPEDAQEATRGQFVSALRRELPPAVARLQEASIAPVDLAQAAIGPGMEIFSRYAAVREANDQPMAVHDALALINEALDEILSEQDADYDSETRFALTWFENQKRGFSPGPYGEAETLAMARNVSVAGVAEAGILEAGAGRVRLLQPAELPGGWNPASDDRLTTWECVHHMIRALESDGEAAAAALLALTPARQRDAARELAYRLYAICEKQSRAADALRYNTLMALWGDLSRQADTQTTPQPTLALPEEE
ncbi:MAG: DUF1156 domain-containing protein [Deltaproteobacteria bacterium]|nr:DUF1156 domain-containing protein [Deltaproteobacteria bacterium]